MVSRPTRLLESTDEITVNLLFTDVVLGAGANGEQLAEWARSIRPDLKVLLTTGYAGAAIVHQGRVKLGAELLAKPFTYAELAAKIREVLDRGKPNRS